MIVYLAIPMQTTKELNYHVHKQLQYPPPETIKSQLDVSYGSHDFKVSLDMYRSVYSSTPYLKLESNSRAVFTVIGQVCTALSRAEAV